MFGCELPWRTGGRPDLADDARYRRNADRVAHRDQLVPELARLCRTRTTQDWLTALGACGVPCGPINDLAAVYADPQVRHRGLSFEVRDGCRFPLCFADAVTQRSQAFL